MIFPLQHLKTPRTPNLSKICPSDCWRVPNPPGANPLIAERAPWRCDPNSHSWEGSFSYQGVSTRGVRHAPGLFLGVPVRGSKICRKFVRNCRFANFRQILTNFRPLDWNPQKQSLGQILDKFGVRGVFKCCKGKRVRKPGLDLSTAQRPEICF